MDSSYADCATCDTTGSGVRVSEVNVVGSKKPVTGKVAVRLRFLIREVDSYFLKDLQQSADAAVGVVTRNDLETNVVASNVSKIVVAAGDNTGSGVRVSAVNAVAITAVT